MMFKLNFPMSGWGIKPSFAKQAKLIPTQTKWAIALRFKIYVLTALLLLIFSYANAQSNLQTFTPSVLLQLNQLEINVFNSLYTQTKERNKNGNITDLGGRQSFFRNTFSILYGVSESRRINVGFQANIASVSYSATGFSKTIFSSIGPVVKLTPFKKVGFLSVQSTLLLPVSSDIENPFIDHERITWMTQIFFDKAINDDLRVFLESGLLYRFKNLKDHSNFFRIPLSAIVSYFPSSKSTIFASLQHSPAFGKTSTNDTAIFGQINWFTALGLGAKYQITPSTGLELSYSNFILSRNNGAGSNINFGVRIII